jgi:protein-arginine kinase
MTTSLNSSRPVLDQDARSGQSRIRTILTASTTLTQELHDGQTIGFNALAGLTVTLPAATGTGMKFRFYVAVLATSNSYIIQVANATDFFVGEIMGARTDSGNAVWVSVRRTLARSRPTPTPSRSTAPRLVR